MPDDITVKVGVDFGTAITEIQKFEKKVRTDIARVMTGTAKGGKSIYSGGFVDVATLKGVRDLRTGFESIGRVKGPKVAEAQYKAMAKQVTYAAKSIKTLDQFMGPINTKVAKLQAKGPPFAGYAMSVMFLGMAMQNAFNRIWTTSQATFQDVMHSVDGMVTGFDQMNMATQYLGYELGRALEPIAAFLAPIITAIADWVSENQGLTTGILATLAVLGTFLAVAGSAKLAIDGIVGSWSALKNNMGGISKTAGVAVSFYLATEAYKDIKSGEVWEGLSTALFGGAAAAAAFGKKGLGAWMAGIGIAFGLVDMVINGQKITRQKLADFMINAGMATAFVNPGVGAALLTFGIAFQLVDDTTLAQFLSTLKVGFAGIVVFIAAILDAILTPVLAIINLIIETYRLISGKEMSTISMTPFTDIAMKKWNDAAAQLDTIRGENTVRNFTPTPPQYDPSKWADINPSTGVQYNGTVIQISTAEIQAHPGMTIEELIQHIQRQ